MGILFNNKFGTKHSKNMAVLTAGSCSCSRSAAQPETRFHRVLLQYISVKFVHVYCIETPPSLQSWNLRKEVLPRKKSTILFFFRMIAEEQSEWRFVL